jgi:hypothetical protein
MAIPSHERQATEGGGRENWSFFKTTTIMDKKGCELTFTI